MSGVVRKLFVMSRCKYLLLMLVIELMKDYVVSSSVRAAVFPLDEKNKLGLSRLAPVKKGVDTERLASHW